MSEETHFKQTLNEKEQIQTCKTKIGTESQQQDQMLLLHPADALQRVTSFPPAAIRPVDILALQSTVGNRTVQRMVERAQHTAGDKVAIQRRFSPPMAARGRHFVDQLEEDEHTFTELELNARGEQEGGEAHSEMILLTGHQLVRMTGHSRPRGGGPARERVEER